MCNDCVPACRVGLGGHMTGTVLYCRSTVTGCSGWGSRDVFPALDGDAGAGHEESLLSILGHSHEQTYLN